jgi:hypothetical protein
LPKKILLAGIIRPVQFKKGQKQYSDWYKNAAIFIAAKNMCE